MHKISFTGATKLNGTTTSRTRAESDQQAAVEDNLADTESQKDPDAMPL